MNQQNAEQAPVPKTSEKLKERQSVGALADKVRGNTHTKGAALGRQVSPIPRENGSRTYPREMSGGIGGKVGML